MWDVNNSLLLLSNAGIVVDSVQKNVIQPVIKMLKLKENIKYLINAKHQIKNVREQINVRHHRKDIAKAMQVNLLI